MSARELAEQILAFTERDDWRDAVAKDLARLVLDELLPVLEQTAAHVRTLAGSHAETDDVTRAVLLVADRALARVGDTPKETRTAGWGPEIHVADMETGW